jgi:hypothetical protein
VKIPGRDADGTAPHVHDGVDVPHGAVR